MHLKKILMLSKIRQMLKEHTERSCFYRNLNTPTQYNSKRSFVLQIREISTYSSNLWTLTYTRSYAKTYLEINTNVMSSTKQQKQYTIYILLSLYIEISNLQMYSLMKIALLKFVILGLLDRSRIKRNFLLYSQAILLLDGTERQKFYLALQSIQNLQMFGVSDV